MVQLIEAELDAVDAEAEAAAAQKQDPSAEMNEPWEKIPRKIRQSRTMKMNRTSIRRTTTPMRR